MDKFNDVELLELIASGGMAEVYRAKHQSLHGFEKIVAVKRILPHFASNQNFKHMFVQEAKLTATLEHPNIAQIYNYGESQGYLYMIMEFIDGQNLRNLLEKTRESGQSFPPEFACYLVCEILKGLEYAHSRVHPQNYQPLNIIHRDISPHNIMITYEGSIKLVDFGIAKNSFGDELTRDGILKGKFGYMSPEQAEGHTLDKRSDIFSIGIILWELLTGERLFKHDNDFFTLEKIKQCNVTPPTQLNNKIDADLEKITLIALQKNPKDRYQSCQELYSDLARFSNQKYPAFIHTDLAIFMKKLFNAERAMAQQERAYSPSHNSESTHSSTHATFHSVDSKLTIHKLKPKIYKLMTMFLLGIVLLLVASASIFWTRRNIIRPGYRWVKQMIQETKQVPTETQN